MAKKLKPVTKVTCFADLSPAQKGNMATWLYEVYRDYYVENKALPIEPEQHETIIRQLTNKIKQDNIIIPDKQIQLYYNSKQNSIIKRLRKEFTELGE
ncbi:MAG: hypothetical protein K2J32_05360 [Ruminococcus sp.]|nr:hypothetical protein [Ruminococcus sp.]